MANTITNTQMYYSLNRVLQYVTISSDGTEETDYVLYDSSTTAASNGVSDPLDSTITRIQATTSCASTARLWLEFDATTDVLALDIPPSNIIELDFTKFGGLKNTAGTGITGDITLTTTGLESGDKITIILEVKPN